MQTPALLAAFPPPSHLSAAKRANGRRITRRAGAWKRLRYKINCKRVELLICARDSAVGCMRWLARPLLLARDPTYEITTGNVITRCLSRTVGLSVTLVRNGNAFR